MAGVGVKLNKLFGKHTIATNLVGFVYSSAITVAPMFLVILEIVIAGWVLGFNQLGFVTRELFSCTVLYIFIFSLLTAAPFNAVLSKYMEDCIYEERFQDILPCYYLGLAMNIGLSCLLGVPFCLWEHFVGGVRVFYVFTGFCGYIGLVFTFYSMLYLSICKDYGRISLDFLIGMLEAFLCTLFLRYLLHWNITESMLFGLMTGFFLTGILEFGVVKRYFLKNSNRFRPVFQYFKKYWALLVTNFMYILGLYIHNFVFWTTDMRLVLVDTFVCNQPYDMASCLAMFTNISATVIFIARVEMNFHAKYKIYSEAVIGAKLADIEIAKSRMFRQISSELMSLARIQFIVSTVIYLIAIVVLPGAGYSGLTLRIYPCLAAGYFIVFIMYAVILFLYYYNDLLGAVFATVGFCVVTFLGSVLATHLPELWYGVGLVAGAFTGWTIGYIRLRSCEKNLDKTIFCTGVLLKRVIGDEPTGLVYDRDAQKEGEEEAVQAP